MKKKFFILGGRFQPFHNGHLEMIKLLVSKYKKDVVIGIANPDPEITYPGDKEWIRFSKKDNPLSYWERFHGISSSINATPELEGKVTVTPMPRPSVNLLRADNYLPPKPRVFVVFERRGDVIAKWKYEQYNNLDEESMLFDYRELTKNAQLSEGAIIRDLIGLGSSFWEKFVPKENALFLKRINVRNKILLEGFDEETAKRNILKFAKENDFSISLSDNQMLNDDFILQKQIDNEIINWLKNPFSQSQNELVVILEKKIASRLENVSGSLFKSGTIKTLPRLKEIPGNLYQAEITIEVKNKLIEHFESK